MGRALGFADGGFAWSDPAAEFSLRDLRWTLGPGIYAKTPLGQVELDWGYRLNPPSLPPLPGSQNPIPVPHNGERRTSVSGRHFSLRVDT